MKAPINFNKHHRETSSKSSRCSFVSVFLCLWLLTMLGGSLLFFRDTIAPPLESSAATSAAPPTAGGDGGLRREPIKLALQAPPVNLVARPLPGLRLGQPEAARRNASREVKPKPKPPAPPLPLLKTKDMWGKTAVQQREYLQSIHSEKPAPSSRAAEEFLRYVADANAGVSSKLPEPSVFDTPNGPRGSPGQPGDANVPYHIAGKDVHLPYGHPEESIFILTASYRDPEAASTIARAYARAAHPERIFFGIHAQNEGGDAEPERDPIGGLAFTGLSCPSHPICKYINQVRVSRAHWALSEGPTVARALAERLYRNETYVLGVDSHCHFLRGWDNVGIDMFRRIGNDLAIITSYPASYGANLQRGHGAEDYDIDPAPETQQSICRTRRVNIHTTVTFKHDMNRLKRPKHGPVRVAWFAAGFSFSRGHRILRVPYDYHTPYVFDGEETSMGVRAWTWGYDLYHPDRDIISHLYIPSGSSLRPVFWDSPYWGIQWPTQFASLVRVQKQLRIYLKLQGSVKGGRDMLAVSDLGEFERYDVGPRRTPAQFFDWAGVDIQNNWGPGCTNPTNPNVKGREQCYSKNLCEQFDRGGMPYVPWAAGTDDLFPPMIRTPQNPPPV